jgi:hypothetical protein
VVVQTKRDAIRVIEKLDLTGYADKAVRLGQLSLRDKDTAMKEYRQFMLLLWVNKMMSESEYVVPTEHADAIWHQHILDSSKYRLFSDELVGSYIDHFPGLEKGTPAFNRAVDHTKGIQHQYGTDNGFFPLYFAVCGATVESPATHHSPDSNGHHSVPTTHVGDHSVETSHSSAPATCGSSHSSCGGASASCGGGGGGGCGGS